MPITDSAKKALRQNKRRRIKNVREKRAFQSAIKDFKRMVAEKKMDETKHKLSLVYKKLDKAVKTNVLKKNTAARLKSRLSKKINTKA